MPLFKSNSPLNITAEHPKIVFATNDANGDPQIHFKNDAGTTIANMRCDVTGGTLNSFSINSGTSETDFVINSNGSISLGTVLASAYLDADTAHLSATQTFTGAKTFTNSVTVGVDDTGQDVKFFGASSGAFMLYDQASDQLEIRGAAADATTSTGKLLLSTALTDINANDVIGKIDFQAPLEAGGTDAITVAASIQAIAQGTFSGSVNATDLIFYTGHSEAATEKIRITSQGEIGIGGANYGTDGQVLTSTGAGTAPAWEDAGGGGASDLDGLTDVSLTGSGQAWNFVKNGTTPDGAAVVGAISGATGCVAIGGVALDALISGDNNYAFGEYALSSLTTGSDNIAFGYQAQFSNVSGVDNIALGWSAGRQNTGSYNISIGDSANYNVTGSGNVSVGHMAGKHITTGNYNTTLGYFADNHLTGSASYNILIGMFTTPGTAGNNSQFVLGHGHVASKYLMSGDFATTNEAKLGINLGGAGGNQGAANMPTATLHVKGQGTTTNTALLIEDSGGTDRVEVKDNGTVFMYSLPTSDPSVAGQLWNDSNTLKVSAG